MARDVLEPEVLPARRDPFAEKLAWALDGMVSIGGWRVGLDGLIGLVPGLGDILSALISMIIVLRAAQAGIPRIAIARMVTNIAIDTFVGAIPILGDLFDVAWKSNLKNLKIYEDALRRGRASNARHWGFFLLLFAALAVVMAAAAFAVLFLIRHLVAGLHTVRL